MAREFKNCIYRISQEINQQLLQLIRISLYQRARPRHNLDLQSRFKTDDAGNRVTF